MLEESTLVGRSRQAVFRESSRNGFLVFEEKRYIKTDGGYAEMSDGFKVEISRRKKDDFVAMLGVGV